MNEPLSDHFSTEVERACEAAIQACGGVERRFCELAGVPVELCFIGKRLQPMIWPGLEGMTVISDASGNAKKTPVKVFLWDGQETGVPIPRCPWNEKFFIPRGDLPQETLPAGWQVAYRAWADELTLLDERGERAWFHIRDADFLHSDYIGNPLLVLAGWLAGTAGWRVAHAAAVGQGENGILLVGRGGSGKSTSALSCLAAGWRYISDDYCLVRAEPEATVGALYRTAKVDAEHLRRIPLSESLKRQDFRSPEAKAVLLPDLHCPEQLARSLRLRAIIAPTVDPVVPESRLVPISAGAALRALAPSTIFQLAGAGDAHFRVLARLVREVPCYRLALGSRIEGIPEALEKLVR